MALIRLLALGVDIRQNVGLGGLGLLGHQVVPPMNRALDMQHPPLEAEVAGDAPPVQAHLVLHACGLLYADRGTLQQSWVLIGWIDATARYIVPRHNRGDGVHASRL